MRQRRMVGYLLGILGAAFYGLNPLFALPLYADGMELVSVLFWRYSLSIPLLGLLMWLQGVDFRLKRGEALQLAILGILMALSSLSLYVSYRYMDAGLASTILFVYPIMTAFLMAFVFKERISWLVWGCLGLASAGIVVLCEINGPANVSLAGILAVVLSALTYAVYLVFINKGQVTSLSPTKVTFYVIVFGTLLLSIILVVGGNIDFPQGLHWGYSIGSAVFPTALSLVMTTLAIQYIGSTKTAILGAMEPLTAVAIGVLIFHEHLTLRSWIGIAMIVVAVTAVVAQKK